MRKIKFRAWDKEGKSFISEGTSIFGIAGVIAGYHVAGVPDRLVFMQYTGLKDKNGKEIYEGDIVLGGRYKSRGDVVEWFVCGFAPFGFSVFGDEDYDANSCEVIGNIYEHGDLLTKYNDTV